MGHGRRELVPETPGDDEDEAGREVGHGGGDGRGRHLHALQQQSLESCHPGTHQHGSQAHLRIEMEQHLVNNC